MIFRIATQENHKKMLKIRKILTQKTKEYETRQDMYYARSLP